MSIPGNPFGSIFPAVCLPMDSSAESLGREGTWIIFHGNPHSFSPETARLDTVWQDIIQ